MVTSAGSQVPAALKPRAVVPKLSFDSLKLSPRKLSPRTTVVPGAALCRSALAGASNSHGFAPASSLLEVCPVGGTSWPLPPSVGVRFHSAPELTKVLQFEGVTVPTSASEESGERSTPTSSSSSPHRLRLVPKLSLVGLRPSLQGCNLLGAPPPEEPLAVSSDSISWTAPAVGPETSRASDSEESSMSQTLSHRSQNMSPRSARAPRSTISQFGLSPRGAPAPKRPAAVPKLSFRCLKPYSPRGLRQSPRSFRSPLNSPGATIPEEPLATQDSSVSSRSVGDSSASGVWSGRTAWDRRRTIQDVPMLPLAGLPPSLQGTLLLGAPPPEELAWQAAPAPSRPPRGAGVHAISPRSRKGSRQCGSTSPRSLAVAPVPVSAPSVQSPSFSVACNGLNASCAGVPDALGGPAPSLPGEPPGNAASPCRLVEPPVAEDQPTEAVAEPAVAASCAEATTSTPEHGSITSMAIAASKEMPGHGSDSRVPSRCSEDSQLTYTRTPSQPRSENSESGLLRVVGGLIRRMSWIPVVRGCILRPRHATSWES